MDFEKDKDLDGQVKYLFICGTINQKGVFSYGKNSIIFINAR